MKTKMSNGSSGKEITVFLTMVPSQLPAPCASNHILSKQEGKVLSRHHCLRRTSSELFCPMLGISLSLVSVSLSMLTPCHSPSGPQVALKPLVWYSPRHGDFTPALLEPLPSSRRPSPCVLLPPYLSRPSPNDGPSWMKAASPSQT